MGIDPQWFSVVGLLLDIAGAIVLTYGLILTKHQAVELSATRIMGDTEEENLELPQVVDRLRQSRNAKVGLWLLVMGFLLQLVGNWPQ